MKFKKIVLAYDMEGVAITDVYVRGVRIVPLSGEEVTIGPVREHAQHDVVQSFYSRRR